MSHFFYGFALLISIYSEKPILSYLAFIIHTNTHLRKRVGNTLCLLEKQII